MAVKRINVTDDTLDVSDIVARFEYLGKLDRQNWSSDEHSEYEAIEQLLEDVSPEDNDILINEDYFEEYAQEVADRMGTLPNSQRDVWPFNHIDWEDAAYQLSTEYSSVEFLGTTFYFTA